MRQPTCSISHAATGRNTSCPVAALAVSRPSTSPRRRSNQRVATTAPSTTAVRPVPNPSSSPHKATRCQTSDMRVANNSPKATRIMAVHMMRRRP